MGKPATADITAGEARFDIPGAVAQRAAGSGLLNEREPLRMVDALYRWVCSSLSAGRFPFGQGADCSLLVALPL